MALRYFNAAGASPGGEIGEAHQPETHLIPRACLAALGRIPPLEIFGTDYPTPDGTALRDYIHVLDLAAAHVLAITALLAGAPPAVYNLGNGQGISVKDILQCCERLGFPVPHRFGPRRAGDPARLIADSSRARQGLGWVPQYEDISFIVDSAYRWHSRQGMRPSASADDVIS
jgi:UDP-glucose 4-epimerase